MRSFLLALSFFCLFLSASAQVTFPTNGAPNPNHNFFAFTNATIHIDYQTVVTNATLLVRDGKVVSAGTEVPLPKGTVTYDLKGKHIYPSFIDLHSNYGLPTKKKGPAKPP